MVFIVDKVLYEHQTETICITSNKDRVIKTCKQIVGDYNVTVWIDGKFSNVYMDISEGDLKSLF